MTDKVWSTDVSEGPLLKGSDLRHPHWKTFDDYMRVERLKNIL